MDSIKRLIVLVFVACLPSLVWAYGEADGKVGSVFTADCTQVSKYFEASSLDGAASACVAALNARPPSGGIYRGCSAVVDVVYGVHETVPMASNIWNVNMSSLLTLVRYQNPPPPAAPCTPTGSAPTPNTAGGGSFGVTSQTKFRCEDGASPLAVGSTVCQCNLGLRAKTNEDGKRVCEIYSCPPSGTHAGVQPDIKVQQAGQAICRNGCVDTPSKWKVGPDDVIWAVSPYRATGEFCGGAKDDRHVETGNDNIEPPPVACGDGLCPGTVNGASVCVACKSETTPGPSEAASGVTPGKDPNGTIKKSEKETSCSGTTCTTTTKHKDGAGNVVGTETKTEPKQNFCQQNPGLSICKEGSFGGSCGAFTCQGDAVQCALAKEVHRANCEWQKVDDALKQKGNDAIAGGLRPSDHPGSNIDGTSLAFSSVIDQTERIGSGCPVDVAVSYAGRSWVIPWSQHCDKLQLIGNLMVAVCMLAAAVIVFRG